jgi:alkyldihydroxyacetonephosphate synthase
MRRRKWWGWGYEDDGVDETTFAGLLRALGRSLGDPDLRAIEVTPTDRIELRPPRFPLPIEFADFVTAEPLDRLAHAYGKAYIDVVRAVRGDVPNPPDYVAYPQDELDISGLMRFCEGAPVAITPYGGGTSVVGGVEPTDDRRFRGTITLDLQRFDRLREIDPRSQLAHVEAGVLGPVLEAGLRPQGLTLRHFPQSFEFSSVGGWIVTRAAGHYATGPTHIDDLVAGVRVLSPRGVFEVVPRGYAGGGPGPERLVLGSEGTLGVVTRAWLRLHAVPKHRASDVVRFEDPAEGIEAVRAVVQSGLQPSNCRLVSPLESALTGLGGGRTADLLLGFESADHPVDEMLDRAKEICADHGGTWVAKDGPPRAASGGPERWRRWFLQAPYLRDRLVLRGLIVETLETASTWTAFSVLHDNLLHALQAAVDRECGRGFVTWRLTHAYPDGVAPYYTIVAAGEPGHEIEQWTAIKAVASNVIEASGGTATHHHAVGRTHLPWYERERGPLLLEAFASAKRTLDPAGIMNPGVLLPETPDPA